MSYFCGRCGAFISNSEAYEIMEVDKGKILQKLRGKFCQKCSFIIRSDLNAERISQQIGKEKESGEQQ